MNHSIEWILPDFQNYFALLSSQYDLNLTFIKFVLPYNLYTMSKKESNPFVNPEYVKFGMSYLMDYVLHLEKKIDDLEKKIFLESDIDVNDLKLEDKETIDSVKTSFKEMELIFDGKLEAIPSEEFIKILNSETVMNST